jgi:hypothetical protein
MSFWLFNPTSLISSKNVLIYKISSFEELMNLFTIMLVSLAVIFKDKLADEFWKKIFFISFLVVFVMGVMLHLSFSPDTINVESNTNEFIEGIEIPKLSNSLSIDN